MKRPIEVILTTDERYLITRSKEVEVSNFFWDGKCMDWQKVESKDIKMLQNGAVIPVGKNRHNKYEVHGIRATS